MMKKLIPQFLYICRISFLGWLIFTFVFPALCLEQSGADLFTNHCIGCHLNGNNIIRHSKTLSQTDLCKQGIFNVPAIAAIAQVGIGQMTGYDDELNVDEAQKLSEWIYLEALNGWN